MIPTRYLEELKSAPMDKLDFVATFQEVGTLRIRPHLRVAD